eukprot:scaffold599265_cov51-Prasinocladus_malaysianus.AAC.2
MPSVSLIHYVSSRLFDWLPCSSPHAASGRILPRPGQIQQPSLLQATGFPCRFHGYIYRLTAALENRRGSAQARDRPILLATPQCRHICPCNHHRCESC